MKAPHLPVFQNKNQTPERSPCSACPSGKPRHRTGKGLDQGRTPLSPTPLPPTPLRPATGGAVATLLPGVNCRLRRARASNLIQQAGPSGESRQPGWWRRSQYLPTETSAADTRTFFKESESLLFVYHRTYMRLEIHPLWGDYIVISCQAGVGRRIGQAWWSHLALGEQGGGVGGWDERGGGSGSAPSREDRGVWMSSGAPGLECRPLTPDSGGMRPTWSPKRR